MGKGVCAASEVAARTADMMKGMAVNIRFPGTTGKLKAVRGAVTFPLP